MNIRDSLHTKGDKEPLVRQTTNPTVVRILIVINLIIYILLWYLNDKYTDIVPRFYTVGLFLQLYLIRLYVRSRVDPLENGNSLEFYREPITLVVALLLPTGIAYLLFTYGISVISTVALAAYITSVVVGFIVVILASGYKVILKDHTVVFIRGTLFRKSHTIPYKNIRQVLVSAATNGITVITDDKNLDATCRWMDNVDTLQKLLRQRVEAAQSSNTSATSNLTLEELADLRIQGAITDEEFNAAIEKVMNQ